MKVSLVCVDCVDKHGMKGVYIELKTPSMATFFGCLSLHFRKDRRISRYQSDQLAHLNPPFIYVGYKSLSKMYHFYRSASRKSSQVHFLLYNLANSEPT